MLVRLLITACARQTVDPVVAGSSPVALAFTDPSPILVHPDADWRGSVRNVVPRCVLTATGLFVSLPHSALPPVQSGAIRNSGDADTMAPFSAPLGTTVGTFLGPSVPVACSADVPESGPIGAIGGSDARAPAWS